LSEEHQITLKNLTESVHSRTYRDNESFRELRIEREQMLHTIEKLTSKNSRLKRRVKSIQIKEVSKKS
jgi:hypothetical protein